MLLARLGKVAQVLPLLTVFICLAGIIKLQSKQYNQSVARLKQPDYFQKEQEQKRLVKVQKQIPAFGLDNLVADWSYLSFVQYFGDKPARDKTGYSLVLDHFEAISKRDPRFAQAHLSLSTANTMYAANPDRTVALMNQVLQSISADSPHAALLWTSKGLDELLFLGDKKAALHSYTMAARSASLNNLDDNFTSRSLETAILSASKPDIKQAQIIAWSSVLTNVKDAHRRQEIINKIDSLKAEIQAVQPHK